jgi:hypothetical protein
LALAEHLRASQVLQLLKMANSPIDGMCSIEQNIEKHKGLIAYLRKTKQREALELEALNNKIRSANDTLMIIMIIFDYKKTI